VGLRQEHSSVLLQVDLVHISLEGESPSTNTN